MACCFENECMTKWFEFQQLTNRTLIAVSVIGGFANINSNQNHTTNKLKQEDKRNLLAVVAALAAQQQWSVKYIFCKLFDKQPRRKPRAERVRSSDEPVVEEAAPFRAQIAAQMPAASSSAVAHTTIT